MSSVFSGMTRKEKTNAFNKFTVEERIEFLKSLSEEQKEKFVRELRK